MDDTVARLGRLDACAVSDALDKLQLAGVVTGIQRLTTDRRISGRVVTVKLEKDDGRPVASRHLGTAAIEAAQAGVFAVRGVPPNQLQQVLAIHCPTVLFPYARETIADATMRAGFPPVHLAPINFEALYQQQLAQASAEAPAVTN